jgi:hypothetical protein
MEMTGTTEDGIVGDDALQRRLFISLTQAEQDAFLNAVRERRLAPVRLYKESLAKKANIRNQRTLELINKQSAMMEKEITALEKAMSKVEARATMLSALCNQVEFNV